MNTGNRRIATLLLGLWATEASSYEVPTHQLLTQQATSRSLLGNPSFLGEIGLAASDQFVASDGVRRTLSDTMIWGVAREDDGLLPPTQIRRFCNHFFDPQFAGFTGRGLDDGGDRGQPSPDWALEDRFEVATLANAGQCQVGSGGQAQLFSYRHALLQYYQGLTGSTPANREASFGAAFETLGHVIHHIQDMAQPQHTRNDGHALPPNNFYEKYTRDHVSATYLQNLLQQNQLPVPSMPTVRHFWQTPGTTVPRFGGMAEFVAQNYVTPKRMFSAFRNNAGTVVLGNTLGFPMPNGFNHDGTAMRVAPYLYDQPQEDGTIRRESADVVLGDVYDEYPGVGAVTWTDVRLATYSLLTGPLTRLGRPSTNLLSASPLTFDDNYRVLLPRAVAFSAGVLNHFMRGRMGLRRDATGTQWIIENLSSSGLGMNGTFTVWAQSVSGQRSAVPGAAFVRNLAAGQSTTVTMSEPPAGTVKLVLVFIGQIGSEVPADDGFRSIAGRVIDFPQLPTPCGGTLKAEGGVEGLDVTREMGTSGGNMQLKFEAYSLKDSLVVTAVNGANTQLYSTGGMVSGLHTQSIAFNSGTLGTSKVRVRVVGSEFGTLWTLALSCPGQSLGSGDFPPIRTVRFDFGSAGPGAGGSCQAGFYVDGVFLGNAYVSSIGGTSLNAQLTKGPDHGAEFRNFSCTAGNQNLTIGAQYTDPSGTVRLQNMNQTGVFFFTVR